MEGGIVRNADGWTDMEMQTVTFATLQTLSKEFILQFLINYVKYETRIFLEEQKMARKHFTHLHKLVYPCFLTLLISMSSIIIIK